MNQPESKIGKRYQTVVPMAIRETASIAEGDSLLWSVLEDGTIVVKPVKSKVDYLAHPSTSRFGALTKKRSATWPVRKRIGNDRPL